MCVRSVEHYSDDDSGSDRANGTVYTAQMDGWVNVLYFMQFLQNSVLWNPFCIMCNIVSWCVYSGASRKSRRKIARPRKSTELYNLVNEDLREDRVLVNKRADKLPKADGSSGPTPIFCFTVKSFKTCWRVMLKAHYHISVTANIFTHSANMLQPVLNYNSKRNNPQYPFMLITNATLSFNAQCKCLFLTLCKGRQSVLFLTKEI